MNAINRLYATDTERWAALRARDPGADPYFFVSIASTGIYCRPSCASRPARPENVAFHADRESAERAGFRACKRCRPDLPPRAEREAAIVAAACRQIDEAEEMPVLADLAASAALSPHHFHRLFRRIAGVTPAAYARAQRTRRVAHELAGSGSVTEAIYGAGFNSSGRFYEAADGMLGMTPSAYRAGGAGQSIVYASTSCSLGQVLVAATHRGICAILLGDAAGVLAADLSSRFPHATLTQAEAGTADFANMLDAVVRLVDRPGDGIALPLDIQGTIFQRRVWEALRAIPAGETRSYAQVAAEIGAPRAVRAVATACAGNKVAVAIPCHRVVASGGTLAGYRWGVARKRALLDRERA